MWSNGNSLIFCIYFFLLDPFCWGFLLGSSFTRFSFREDGIWWKIIIVIRSSRPLIFVKLAYVIRSTVCTSALTWVIVSVSHTTAILLWHAMWVWKASRSLEGRWVSEGRLRCVWRNVCFLSGQRFLFYHVWVFVRFWNRLSRDHITYSIRKCKVRHNWNHPVTEKKHVGLQY